MFVVRVSECDVVLCLLCRYGCCDVLCLPGRCLFCWTSPMTRWTRCSLITWWSCTAVNDVAPVSTRPWTTSGVRLFLALTQTLTVHPATASYNRFRLEPLLSHVHDTSKSRVIRNTMPSSVTFWVGFWLRKKRQVVNLCASFYFGKVVKKKITTNYCFTVFNFCQWCAMFLRQNRLVLYYITLFWYFSSNHGNLFDCFPTVYV